MFNDVDDFLVSTPKDKFMDIVFNASKSVVKKEIEEIINYMATLEVMLEKKLKIEDVEREAKIFINECANEIEDRTNSLYIEYMSKILSESE